MDDRTARNLSLDGRYGAVAVCGPSAAGESTSRLDAPRRGVRYGASVETAEESPDATDP